MMISSSFHVFFLLSSKGYFRSEAYQKKVSRKKVMKANSIIEIIAEIIVKSVEKFVISLENCELCGIIEFTLELAQ